MREKTIRSTLLCVLLSWLFLFLAAVSPAEVCAIETRVFDQANLFSAEEKQALEQQIAQEREKMKLDLVVVTTNEADGKSTEAYADDFYDRGGYGYGEKKSGVLYLIDMDNRRIHVSTAGGGIQLLSDSEIEKLLDLGTPGVKSGNYAESAKQVLSGIQDSYRRAGRKGWSYDAESGVWTKKKHLTPLAALGSFVASLLAALGAVTGVKRSYKMQDSASRRASTVSGIMAMSGVAFHFGKIGDQLLDQSRVRRRIYRSSSFGSGGSSGPHGSSSTHTSSSGTTHGGGGRGF